MELSASVPLPTQFPLVLLPFPEFLFFLFFELLLPLLRPLLPQPPPRLPPRPASARRALRTHGQPHQTASVQHRTVRLALLDIFNYKDLSQAVRCKKNLDKGRAALLTRKLHSNSYKYFKLVQFPPRSYNLTRHAGQRLYTTLQRRAAQCGSLHRVLLVIAAKLSVA